MGRVNLKRKKEGSLLKTFENHCSRAQQVAFILLSRTEQGVKKSGRHIVQDRTWKGQQGMAWSLVMAQEITNLRYLKGCRKVIVLHVWKKWGEENL